jgi:hypothetical protein
MFTWFDNRTYRDAEVVTSQMNQPQGFETGHRSVVGSSETADADNRHLTSFVHPLIRHEFNPTSRPHSRGIRRRRGSC